MRQVILNEGTLDNGYSDCNFKLFLAVFSNIAIVYKQIFHQVLYQRIIYDWHTEVTGNMGTIINA